LLLSSIVFDGFLGSTGTRTGTSRRHPEQTVNGRVPPPHGCPAAACGGVVPLPPGREAENPEWRFTAPRPQKDDSDAAESPSQDPESTALPSPSRWSRTSVATLPPRLRATQPKAFGASCALGMPAHLVTTMPDERTSR
jgi:hypothetical protein